MLDMLLHWLGTHYINVYMLLLSAMFSDHMMRPQQRFSFSIFDESTEPRLWFILLLELAAYLPFSKPSLIPNMPALHVPPLRRRGVSPPLARGLFRSCFDGRSERNPFWGEPSEIQIMLLDVIILWRWQCDMLYLCPDLRSPTAVEKTGLGSGSARDSLSELYNKSLIHQAIWNPSRLYSGNSRSFSLVSSFLAIITYTYAPNHKREPPNHQAYAHWVLRGGLMVQAQPRRPFSYQI